MVNSIHYIHTVYIHTEVARIFFLLRFNIYLTKHKNSFIRVSLGILRASMFLNVISK